MKPTVYITIGLIGAGKTSFANKQALISPSLIVSKDSIRQMLFGVYRFDEVVEPLINKITDAALTSCLSEIILGIAPYNSVILDDCHLTKKDRLSYINLIRNVEYEYMNEGFFEIIYVYFLDPNGIGIARRVQDDRGLGEEHWWKLYDWQTRKIEVPSHKEIEEYNVSKIITMKG